MNKRFHRIVFNRVRGQRMVVQESAASAGKATGATPAVVIAFALSLVPSVAILASVAAVVMALLAGASAANAQIVAAPGAPASLRPTLVVTPNNVPVVNIQTPSAAGVSRNLYQQFDIQRNGAILNNSRNGAQTQIGGAVQANPWLANGPARIILNEIISGNPTQIRGALEVAGQRAQVIVANPAGIAVDGGSFINASRATLTTGTPQFNAAGHLDNFLVRGGNVTIDGAGLDLRSTDYAAILARAIQVNAGIWANELKVVAGANDVSADNTHIRPTSGTGDKPRFALDVAHLGGMYANKIFLIGTEDGLGVYSKGAIGAGPGEVVVTADGWIENRGTIEAASVRLQSKGDIDNRGGTIRQLGNTALSVTSASLSNTDGFIGAPPVPAVTVADPVTGGAPGSGDVKPPVPAAGEAPSDPGTPAAAPAAPAEPPAPGYLRADGSILNDGGTLHAGGLITIETAQLRNDRGRLAVSSLAVSNLAATNHAAPSLAVANLAAPNPSAQGGNALLSNVGGTLHVNDSLAAQVERFDNRGGQLQVGKDFTAQAVQFDNTGGNIDIGATLSAQAGLLDNTQGSVRAGSLHVDTIGDLRNTDGTLASTRNASLSSGGHFDNTRGTVAAGGDLAVRAGTLHSTGLLAAGIRADGSVGDGTPGHTGDLNVSTTQALVTTGTQLAAGRATLAGASLTLDDSQTRAANITLVATEGPLSTQRAVVATPGTLSIEAAAKPNQMLDNSAGTLTAGRIDLHASHLRNQGGLIAQTGDGSARIAIEGTLDNSSGRIAGNGALDLSADRIDNSQGKISALGNLALRSTALVNHNGQIQSDGRIDLSTGTVDNTGGVIDANTALVANTQAFDNTAGGVVRSQGTLAIDTQGGDYDNRGGQTLAVGDLRIDAGAIRNSDGLIRSLATTGLNAGTIFNNKVTASADPRIEGKDILIAADHLDNHAGAIRADGNATLASAGTLDNTDGLISAHGTLRIADAHLSSTADLADPAKPVELAKLPNATLAVINTRGTLVADGHLQLDAASFTGDGTLRSAGDLSVALSKDTVNNAEVSAQGALSYETLGTFTNKGKLLAGGHLTVAGTNVDNTVTGELRGDLAAVRATGHLVNRGLIDGRDTRIDAGVPGGAPGLVTNIGTGRIYGDQISVATGSLINDAETVGGVTRSATIAARDTLDIGAASILNREYSLLFSAGDMFIGGALDDERFAIGQGTRLDNQSASIESLGDMNIAMASIHNTDAHMAVTRTSTGRHEDRSTVTPLGRAELPAEQVLIDPNTRAWAAIIDGKPDGGHGWISRKYFVETETDVAANPPDPGRIVAGGDMTLDGMLHNRDSHVIAGGQLAIAPQNIDNAPTQGQKIVTTDGLSFYMPATPGEVGVAGFIPKTQAVFTIDVGVNRFEGGTLAAQGVAPDPVRAVAVGAQAGAAGGAIGAGSGNAIVQVPSQRGTGPAGATVVRTSAPDTQLPTASVFSIAPTGRTLVQTDTAFTGAGSEGSGDAGTGSTGPTSAQRPWLSSDALLKALGLDPDAIEKRLGDGFYEQRLVREQIARLTGYRFLAGQDNDEDQYAELLSAGATFAKQYQLQPGVALSAEQMAQLTSDIVWLVEQTVTLPDGTTQRVLVPQVYVRVRPGDIDGSGALLSADALVIKPGSDSSGTSASGSFTNRGTIAGRTLVSIQADNIDNLGGRISGGSVDLQARDDIRNIGGTIDARTALRLQAGRDIDIRTTTQTQDSLFAKQTNIDRVAALYVSQPNGTLVASAGRDLNLIGAIVENQGSGGLTALTAQRDIRLGTVTESQARLQIFNAGNYRGEASSREVGTTISTQGTTVLDAGRDIDARQAHVDAGPGVLSLQAGRDIRITSGEATQQILSGQQSTKKGTLKNTTTATTGSFDATTSQGSNFSGGLVAMNAGNNLLVEGSHIRGDQGVLLTAGNQLAIVEARDTANASATRSREGSKWSPIVPVPLSQADSNGLEIHSNLASRSSISSSQGGISMEAGTVQLQGVQVAAAKDIDIRGGNVDISAAIDAREVKLTSQHRGSSIQASGWHDPGKGIDAKNGYSEELQQTGLAPTTLTAANVHIKADDTLRLAGTVVNTGELDLSADTLVLATQATDSRHDQSRQGRDLAWQQNASQGQSDQTTHYNQFHAGSLAINANRVQAGLGARDSVESLAKQPGMGWVHQLNNDPRLAGKVDWTKVEEAHKNWNYSRQGLTPEGAAVVTLVVAYFSAGTATGWGEAAGAAVGGGTTGTVVAGAVTAGVTTLAGQAAVAVINNRGNLGGALDDLGSSANVKNLVTAIVTGGVLGGLALDPTGLPTVQGGAQPFTVQLSQNLTAGAARAAIGTAINGGSFETNLKEGLKSALLDTVAAQGASAIADLTALGTLDDFTNKLAHAMAGCAVGAARAEGGSGCGAGALGAVIGEISGNAYGRDELGNLRPGAVQMAQMFAGIAGAVAGLDAKDIGVAASAGANAAANNALSLRGAARLMTALRACSDGSNVRCDVAQLRQEMTLDADKQAQRIESACASPSSLGQCMALVTSANLSLTNLITGYEYANTEEKRALVADLLSRQLDDMGRLYGSLATQQEAAGVRELLGAAITGSVQVAGMAGINIGAKGGVVQRQRSIDSLLADANAPINSSGISQATRAWDKHSGRPGGTFEPLSGTTAEKNAHVENWVKGVLTNPETTMKQLPRGGVEYRLPSGQGVVFEADGKVNLLDPRRAK